jgi:RsiW-degrading membrane proteinase PrsW (M82 family)
MLIGDRSMKDEDLQSPGDAVSAEKDRAQWLRSLGYLSIILGDIVGFTGVGVGIGYYTWKKWNAPWWVLLLTSMGGLTLSFYRLYKMTQRDTG